MKIRLFTLICSLALVPCAFSQEKTADKNDLILKQLSEISKTLNSKMEKTEKEVEQLRQDLKKLQSQLEELRKTQPQSQQKTYVSTILITNSWNAPVNVQVNDVWHLVAPSSSKVVQVPSGVFTYRVREILTQQLQARPVSNNETFRILIHPQ